MRPDIDEIDLTAFRLAAIGEATKKLSDELKDRHQEIDWAAIYAMRNIIAHHYGSIAPQRVYMTAKTGLTPLLIVCEAELER